MRFAYIALAIACLTVRTTLSQETPDSTEIVDPDTPSETASLTVDAPEPTPTSEPGEDPTDLTTSITNSPAFTVSFDAKTMTSPGTYVTVVNGNTISVIVSTNATRSATATAQVSPTTSRKSGASRDYIPGTLVSVALMGVIGVLVGTV